MENNKIKRNSLMTYPCDKYADCPAWAQLSMIETHLEQQEMVVEHVEREISGLRLKMESELFKTYVSAKRKLDKAIIAISLVLTLLNLVLALLLASGVI